MAIVKFGDVVKEVKCNVDRNTDNHEFFIAGEHMNSENIHLTRKGKFSECDVGPAFIRLFKPGQILYGSRRTYLKKVAVADFEGITSNTTFVLESKDNNKFLQALLPFLMLSDDFTDYAIKHSKGSTNPYILFSDLAKYEFYLPDIRQQSEILRILMSCDELKEAYKCLFESTNNLVKSQFIEMFGNPYTNPKRWRCCSIDFLMRAKASNGFFAKPANYREDGNAGIICVGDVVNRKYSETTDLRRADATEKDFLRYRVTYGDALFCRSSLVKEGIGKASIIPEDVPDNVIFECHVIRIPLDTTIVIPEFFQEFASTDYFREQMMNKSKTATMTTIGQKDIISTEVFVPDMELQLQFKAFSHQADKSKFELQQNIKNLDILMRSIVAKNFKG